MDEQAQAPRANGGGVGDGQDQGAIHVGRQRAPEHAQAHLPPGGQRDVTRRRRQKRLRAP